MPFECIWLTLDSCKATSCHLFRSAAGPEKPGIQTIQTWNSCYLVSTTTLLSNVFDSALKFSHNPLENRPCSRESASKHLLVHTGPFSGLYAEDKTIGGHSEPAIGKGRTTQFEIQTVNLGVITRWTDYNLECVKCCGVAVRNWSGQRLRLDDIYPCRANCRIDVSHRRGCCHDWIIRELSQKLWRKFQELWNNVESRNNL
jgi:hypothetical protein